ncbi:MAG: EamA family transporter [Thermodesulfobacteriota bacterium]|nr:EamA family transporter [Thermodesulfobacteriota bacterium]
MTVKDFSLAIFITAIWGLNFSVIKIGLSSLDPFTLAGVRFLLCAFPLIFFVRKPDVSMGYVIAYGIIFGVGLWGMVSLGIYFGISAGMASLVLQMSAFLTVIMGVVFLREEVDVIKIIGFTLAILGLFFIINLTDGSITYVGLFLVLFGAFSWSIANIIVKKSGAKNVFSFIIWSSLFSPIPLFLLAYLTQDQNIFVDFMGSLDEKAIFSILFQVYPTTLFGYWVWNSLIDKYQVSRVAPLSLLVPIFGILGSFLIFNEVVGFEKIIACVLIFGGLLISSFSNKLKDLLSKNKVYS